jgi:outer membrane protein assembly factor BamB
MAYDTATGELLWSTDIPDGAKGGEPLPETSDDTGFAASSPACDESHVYAIFASGDLAALDHDGKIVWQLYLGRPHNTYGHASSLVYCGEMLIVQWDQEEHSRILALDKTCGRTLWETPRTAGMSWSTPLIMPLCDGYVLLVHASGKTCGMELATGKKLWEVEAVTGEIAPSLTWEKDVWLAANCYSRMVAYRMPQEGAPEMLWEWDEGNLPDVASPVIADGLVFLATDAGEVLCHDLADGRQLWHKEFEDGYYASPVAAEGRVYIVDRKKGLFRVYAVAREAKELSVNPMGEAVCATPAFANGQIFVRGHSHLWCID